MLGMKRATLRNSDEAWGALSDISAAKDRIYQTAIEIRSSNKIIANRVRTFFFSDTVIVFSLADTYEDIYAMLILSTRLFFDALKKCVPMRGGIAHGEFFFNEKKGLFLGEALIRAYQAGECAQWLGIVTDESFTAEAKKAPIGNNIVKWRVPQNDGRIKETNVINWPRNYADSFKVKPVTANAFYEAFVSLFGPYEEQTDSVKMKYLNTVTFINSMLSEL